MAAWFQIKQVKVHFQECCYLWHCIDFYGWHCTGFYGLGFVKKTCMKSKRFQCLQFCYVIPHIASCSIHSTKSPQISYRRQTQCSRDAIMNISGKGPLDSEVKLNGTNSHKRLNPVQAWLVLSVPERHICISLG